MPPAGRIVVGVDGSAGSRAALRWAIRQADLTDASIQAVIAWTFPAAASGYGLGPMVPEDSADYYEELAAKELQSAITDCVDPGCGVEITSAVRRGAAAEVLLDAADEADLLVVGSQGHGGFAGMLLGSVSQHCVRHARCPVAIIREPAA